MYPRNPSHTEGSSVFVGICTSVSVYMHVCTMCMCPLMAFLLIFSWFYCMHVSKRSLLGVDVTQVLALLAFVVLDSILSTTKTKPSGVGLLLSQ